jgi:hypothetical protein
MSLSLLLMSQQRLGRTVSSRRHSVFDLILRVRLRDLLRGGRRVNVTSETQVAAVGACQIVLTMLSRSPFGSATTKCRCP